MPHHRVRDFNKGVTNRLTRRFARVPFGPFALVRHMGRRSGTLYETPIMVEQVEDHFVFALTYGPEVDWYRNVLAAGYCTLVWHGRVYRLDEPEPLSARRALPAYPPAQRFILRLLGTRHFVRLRYHEDGQAAQHS